MKHVHVRAWDSTRANLKFLSAMLREPMSRLLDRLVKEEAKRKDVDLPDHSEE